MPSYPRLNTFTEVCMSDAMATSQRRARDIMERDIFGIEEAIRHFGIPHPERIEPFWYVPWEEETLKKYGGAYLLTAPLSYSIVEILEKVCNKDQISSFCRDWPDWETFFGGADKPKWWLIRKTPAPNSADLTFGNQLNALSRDEKVPPARVMIYAIAGHFLETGEWLYENTFVRCSDGISKDRGVRIGHFGSSGLLIQKDWSDGHGPSLGLASARKPEENVSRRVGRLKLKRV